MAVTHAQSVRVTVYKPDRKRRYMDRIPKPGECYRHFKNKLYQVITVASHTETGEQMVVYQALYGNFGTYVRPLAMFISEVDHEKYPDATQKYRFERVERKDLEQIPATLLNTEDEAEGFEVPSDWEQGPAGESSGAISNKNLLAFLDAETYHEKLEVLKARRGKFSPEEIAAVCESLDIGDRTGDADAQYYAAENFLTMQTKYDGARLR